MQRRLEVEVRNKGGVQVWVKEIVTSCGKEEAKRARGQEDK